MSEESDNDFGIEDGTVIDSAKDSYIVETMLGQGGFGAVFKVHLKSDETKQYAIKIEKKTENRRHSKLKMEIAILKLINSLGKANSHFTEIVDRGKKSDFYFIVMQLVGKSLADLKAERPNKIFSIGTGLGVATQCLEAIEELHGLGYIHRDVKPANYACGLGAQKHVIYILDFGIARKIMKDNGVDLKTPRVTIPFKGTVRYASLACHRGNDLSKKDDCESWFYLLINLIVASGLPWDKIDNTKVMDCKEECRNKNSPAFEQFYGNLDKCKPQLVKVIQYIDQLTYPETPDYEYIYKMLKQAAGNEKVNIDGLYDWEQGSSRSKRHSSKA